MNKKECICKEENAWYNDFGVIKCQYCMGIITDKERLKKIEKYNTPGYDCDCRGNMNINNPKEPFCNCCGGNNPGYRE